MLSRRYTFGNNPKEHLRRGPEGDVKIKKFKFTCNNEITIWKDM